MRTNPNNPPKLPHINTIQKNKKSEDSDFRVHFTLMSVPCPTLNYQHTINTIAMKINQLCRVQLVDEGVVDVSVGLASDGEAYQFLRGRVPIKLGADKDSKQKQREYIPVISRAFQSYMKNREKLEQQEIKFKIKEQLQISTGNNNVGNSVNNNNNNNNNNNTINNNNINNNINNNNNTINNNSNILTNSNPTVSTHHPPHLQQQPISTPILKTKHLWLFGIPIQFCYPDIQKLLLHKQITVLEHKWCLYDHMQYLEVTLQQAIPIPKVFQQLTLKLQNYPLITIPKLQSQTQIPQELSKFTAELTFTNLVQEQNVIHSLDDVGGVNMVIRNVCTLEKEVKYVVVFNNVGNVQRAKNKLAKEYKYCYGNKKPVFLRVGRLRKFYCFQSLVVELSTAKNKMQVGGY